MPQHPLMKKAIRYHRFSDKDQSNHSIERQEMITDQWAMNNRVEIIDTFKDEGFTAKTFDRPDIKDLFEFIRRNNGIDYLIVADLTRFSRKAGEAISMIEEIQQKYNIKIVNGGRGVVYDCTDHNSFFMMVLEFGMGNSENIKRQNDINGGIYAAKAKEGRYVGAKAPFGYKLEGYGKSRKLIPDQETAHIVHFIFDSFIQGTPYNELKKQAKKMGYKTKGSSCVRDYVLLNPIYAGLLKVKAYKDFPGGFFPAIHEPLIEMDTWQLAQAKLQRPTAKPKTTLSDEMPLRGVLKCHCGEWLSGYPAIKPSGKVYYYYKCMHSSHNHISSNKLHDQLTEVLKYLTLPDHAFNYIKEKGEEELENALRNNVKSGVKHRKALEDVEKKMYSLEEKFLANQVDSDTYQRWHSELGENKIKLKALIENCNRSGHESRMVFKNGLEQLIDLNKFWNTADTLTKQRFIRLMFDNSLYYKDYSYRTAHLNSLFSHNMLILKDLKLLLIDEQKQKEGQSPSELSYKDSNLN